MAMARAAVHDNTSGSLRPPPSSWEDIKDLTPAGARLLANHHIHLNTARRFVEEVRCPAACLAHSLITNARHLPAASFTPCVADAALHPTQVGFSSPEDVADITEAEVSRCRTPEMRGYGQAQN